MTSRFRGFVPIVIDVETGGFNPTTDALLEIAAFEVNYNANKKWYCTELCHEHVEPFAGANIEPDSLECTGIIPDHPFRFAKTEKQVLGELFKLVRGVMKKHNCQRAVLVGHNPTFDLSFLKSAVKRCEIKRNPFHHFTTFDTATLGALTVGQTVLARACRAVGIDFDTSEAHSALYDTKATAEFFCWVLNNYPQFN